MKFVSFKACEKEAPSPIRQHRSPVHTCVRVWGSGLHIYIYVCIHMYTYIYIYYIYTYIYIYIYIYGGALAHEAAPVARAHLGLRVRFEA